MLGPSRSSARVWHELLGKKARLSSACHAFQKAQFGSACHILQKKLGSARLALSSKKSSYLEKQKMSWFPTFLPIFKGIILKTLIKVCFFSTKRLYSLKKSTENSQILLNFEKPKARFGLVLKAKSSARLSSPFLKKARLGSACLIKKLGSARQKVGSDPTLVDRCVLIWPTSKKPLK